MLLELRNIQKTYNTKTGVTHRALSNLSLSFEEKGMVFVIGKSGCGKSTLLNIIGGLDRFDSGLMIVGGENIAAMSLEKVDSYRNTSVGFVFQEFNLLETLSVYQNVKLSLDIQGDKQKEKVISALRDVGMGDKVYAKTRDLSGGQRQRVAIARAIVKEPKIILADEPTGALDNATGEEIMKIFKKLSEDRLVIVVSHDAEKAAEYADRIIEMKDGRVYRDVRRKQPGEQVELSKVSVFSNTLVRVDKGSELNDADTARINEVISQTGRKNYVSIETDKRKVKALFPNLREVVDNLSAEEPREESDYSASFVPYVPKETLTAGAVYKRSRLPFSKALYMGVNNLKHKKVRLVITMVLCVVALMLFGVSQSFVNYNLPAAIGKTAIKEESPYLSVINFDSSGNAYDNSGFTKIRSKDFDNLKAQNKNIKMFPQYGFDPVLGVNSTLLRALDGFVIADTLEELNLKPFAGAVSTSGSDFGVSDIIISRFVANRIYRDNNYRVSTPADMVGQKLTMNKSEYTIKGIFDSDVLANSLNHFEYAEKVKNSLMTHLIVKEGFAEHYGSVAGSQCEIIFNQGYTRGANLYFLTPWVEANYEIYKTGITPYADKHPMYLSVDHLTGLLTLSDYSYEGMAAAINVFNQSEISAIIYGETPLYASDNFYIAGIIKDYFNGMVILDGSLTADVISSIIYPIKIYASMAATSGAITAFVKSAYNNSFKVMAQFIDAYDNFSSLLYVLGTAFLILSIVLGIVVVLLLFSFLSASITMTKKQIGIIRALGAKRSDTFLIYAFEGVLIAIGALLLSILLLLIVSPIINAALAPMFGYYVSLFQLGPVHYIFMAVFTVLITVPAILLPLRKYNRISPVEAISS